MNAERKSRKKNPANHGHEESLLERINSPVDLRVLSKSELPRLAGEIRKFMIDTVSITGGHLAPSLGAVELAIALHYCYETPEDKIIWDVGHQAYAHKIITGRRKVFSTLRQFEGISGFPRISESEYDTFSVGHASTSISSGLGIALARDLKKQKHAVVSIIGDGSLSSGLALEGLNNLGIHQDTNITVVLNDNEMSIARNVGALSRYLTRVITDTRFNRIKRDVWELLGRMSDVGKRIRTLVHEVDDALKHFVIPGKLFEDLGLRYVGPVDAHNIKELIEVFKFTKNHSHGPILVHVITKKGKGYSFAEKNATKYHGIGKFSVNTGNVSSSGKQVPSYSQFFGEALVQIGRKHKEVVAISAAMPDGTKLIHFKEAFPHRFFDVGIAESHAVTFAAGLASKGLVPVVAIYSTFLQRAYDQLVHDIALDRYHVVFCIDRAGIVGEDGPTHHGAFDLSYIRHIPGVTIMAPADENELRNMLYTAVLRCTGPTFIRYPRGNARGVKIDKSFSPVPVPKPETVSDGEESVCISIGNMFEPARELCSILNKQGISTAHVNARFVKPLDNKFYAEIFKKYEYIITLESNALAAGFGSAVMELAERQNVSTKFLRFGYPDSFIAHGKIEKLTKSMKLTPRQMAHKVKAFIKHHSLTLSRS